MVAVTDVEPRAPFKRGQRIVRVDRPEHGSMIVEKCVWRGAVWGVEAHTRQAGSFTSAPAHAFVLVPQNWVEPPPLPFVIQYPDRQSSIPEASAAERADSALAMALWWEHVGALVNPALAEQQVEGFRRMAARLMEAV
jgi:hypothetical protein